MINQTNLLNAEYIAIAAVCLCVVLVYSARVAKRLRLARRRSTSPVEQYQTIVLCGIVLGFSAAAADYIYWFVARAFGLYQTLSFQHALILCIKGGTAAAGILHLHAWLNYKWGRGGALLFIALFFVVWGASYLYLESETHARFVETLQ